MLLNEGMPNHALHNGLAPALACFRQPVSATYTFQIVISIIKNF
jgi:hypothetical protein